MSKRNALAASAVVLLLGLAVARALAPSGAPQSPKPEVLQAVAPVFPRIVTAMTGLSDSVVVRVEIDGRGQVASTKVVGGHQILHKAAKDAASRWRFAPGGEATRDVDLTFEFEQRTLSHGNFPAEDLTPVFVPPYKVIVRWDASDRRW